MYSATGTTRAMLSGRLRNKTLARKEDAPEFSAEEICEILGGLPSIATPGTGGAMSDAEALATFRVEVALYLLTFGKKYADAGLFFAPWSLLYAAVATDAMTREARQQALAVAFAMFRAEYDASGRIRWKHVLASCAWRCGAQVRGLAGSTPRLSQASRRNFAGRLALPVIVRVGAVCCLWERASLRRQMKPVKAGAVSITTALARSTRAWQKHARRSFRPSY
jgi:hypothetical protein